MEGLLIDRTSICDPTWQKIAQRFDRHLGVWEGILKVEIGPNKQERLYSDSKSHSPLTFHICSFSVQYSMSACPDSTVLLCCYLLSLACSFSLSFSPLFSYLVSLFFSLSKTFPKTIIWPDLWDFYVCAS